jgi:hypothetical protein
LCSYKEVGLESKLVVYKSGMLIDLSGNYVNCGYICYALFSLLLLSAVLAGVILANIMPSP